MTTVWILLGIIGGFGLLFLLIVYLCYLKTFHVRKKDKIPTEEFSIPPGKIYEPHREQMICWMKECRAMNHEAVHIKSFDGLNLYGKYYECTPDSPLELMFHGYRGSAERDLCGGVQRAFSLGHSVLIVDQRASGHSDSYVITFGINESRDCLSWTDYAVKRFGPQRKIILTGISMGAATVMMAADQDLPANVVGILADCGYTSAKEIICQVIRDMGMSPKVAYPFVKLAARWFGGFDLEERSPIEALRNAKVPVIFFHGDGDDFVPCQMSRDNYDACIAPKKLVIMPDAGHGLAYLADQEGYLKALKEFFAPYLA